MTGIDSSRIAKISKHGRNYEIVIDPDAAQAFRKGEGDINDVLQAEEIFEDAKKALRASQGDLEAAFNTTDVYAIATIIVKEGKVPTTSEQRDAAAKQKWNRIVSLIAANAIDAKTNHPIPAATIEAGLEQAQFRLNEKRIEDQLQDAIAKLRPVLAFKFEEKRIEIFGLAANVAGQCLNVAKQLGSLEKENWGNDGTLAFVISIPAGLTEEFIDKLNALTHGQAQIKFIE